MFTAHNFENACKHFFQGNSEENENSSIGESDSNERTETNKNEESDSYFNENTDPICLSNVLE